ncbi:Acg family FMN-binding oxidoreductase [Nocardia sp. MW-W600-9]
MTPLLFDVDTITAALELAVKAPSVHNTQPWRWQVGDGRIDLFSDPARRLPVEDPNGHAMVISCGAALHHLRVALAVTGWSASPDYLPDPDDPTHLATVTVSPRPPSDTDIQLAAAILLRKSERRRFAPLPIPAGALRGLSSTVVEFGAVARNIPEQMLPLLDEPMRAAAARHRADAAYLRELASWSGRTGHDDGVPSHTTVLPRRTDSIPLREFSDPGIDEPTDSPDHASWVVIGTTADDRRAQLRAGEATSALLLGATSLGLSTCIQSEPLGIPDLRDTIRRTLLHDCAHPQVVVRVGRLHHTAAPVSASPRRPLAEVLEPLARHVA